MSAPHGNRLSPSAFRQSEAHSQVEWETVARQLLDQGEAFLAYDLARSGLEHYPESLKLKQVSALALVRTGAVGEARKILDPLCPHIALDEDALDRAIEEIRQAGAGTGHSSDHDHASQVVMEALQRASQESTPFSNSIPVPTSADEETLGLLAGVYKEAWKKSGDPAQVRHARDTYLRTFLSTRGHWTGINAATMSWLVGDTDLAEHLAYLTLKDCETASSGAEPDYWLLATEGEAYLLMGREQEAVESYRKAAKLAGHKHANIVASLKQLRMLASHEFQVPEELFQILKSPTIVVFTGHMIDQPDRQKPRFPQYLEAAVRTEIHRHLEEMDARIGYSSAACGSDILFLEAMRERDGEINIVLPFHLDDFIKTSLAFAGRNWITRFEKLLEQATSVKYVTEERYLDDDILFAFANQMLNGYADLRARHMGTEPYLLTVWDGTATNLPGGTSDSISRWPDQDKVHVIRSDELLAKTPPAPSMPADQKQETPTETASPIYLSHSCKRVIKTMLFADVVGYSKLHEENTPSYMFHFLVEIANHLKKATESPGFINTWGDAIFAVMTKAMPMAEYALALQHAVCNTDWTGLGLPGEMSVRIALHAGPVFEGEDPIMGRQNFYGSHVNRAARMEPVTVPGCVFASELFTALLHEEQVAAELAARHAGEPFRPPFAWEYLGKLALAKNFGSQVVYRIHHTAPGR